MDLTQNHQFIDKLKRKTKKKKKYMYKIFNHLKDIFIQFMNSIFYIMDEARKKIQVGKINPGHSDVVIFQKKKILGSESIGLL